MEMQPKPKKAKNVKNKNYGKNVLLHILHSCLFCNISLKQCTFSS